MSSEPPSEVVRARIRPPRRRGGGIVRARAANHVVSGVAGSLVLVIAGAGYGKSTTVLQAISETQMRWAWCSCDRRMRSSASLAANVVAAVQECLPGFAAGRSVSGPPDHVALMLANELDATTADDVGIVLDDVHEMLESESWSLLENLVMDLPRTAHLVLISRVALPLSLARLRTQGEVIEINERDLVLNSGEARELADRNGWEITDQQVDDTLLATEGWPAGFMLAARHGDITDVWRGAQHERLFEYLADEILSSRPAGEVEVLESLAVLDRVSPSLALTTTGDPRATDVVRTMEREHLLVTRIDADGEWYRFHNLLLAFLRQRLDQRAPDNLAQLHRNAAQGWLAVEQTGEAVRHLLKAGEFAEVADVLDPVAEEMALSPDAAELEHWLGQLPHELVRKRPSLVLASAVLKFGRGFFEASFASLEDAIRDLAQRGEHDRAAVALVRLWQSMNVSGTSARRRIELTESLIGLIDPAAAMIPLARVQLATGHAWAGQREQAVSTIDDVMSSHAASDPSIAAFAEAARAFYIDFPAGSPETAQRSLLALRQRLERIGTTEAVTLAVFAAAFRAIVLNDLGRYEDALAETGALEDGTIRAGFSSSVGRTSAWLRGVALAGTGHTEAVPVEVLDPPAPSDGRTTTHYAYRYLSPAAAVAAARGDIGSLERIAQSARVAILAQGPELDQPAALCDIAEAAMCAGARGLAETTLRDAHRAATSLDLPWQRTRACILLAAIRTEDATDRVREALGLIDALDGLDAWTVKCRRWTGGVLGAHLVAIDADDPIVARIVLACGREVLDEVVGVLAAADPNVRQRFAGMLGPAAFTEPAAEAALLRDAHPQVRAAARRNLARGSPDLRPRLRYVGLGGFNVLADGEPVPRSAFGREKARALLASLLCAGRPVHREELLEWHWPDLPPDRAVRVFHVTMHALRRAVTPGLSGGDATAAVISAGESYAVHFADGDTFDASEFLELTRVSDGLAPGERLARLVAAEEVYSGPLYPEWPYADWAQERRRQCELAYADVVWRLGTTLMEVGQPREALARFEVLGALEPEREEWHRSLMRAYAAAGERALALRQFHACRAVMRREIGVEPSEETRDLYRELLGPGPGPGPGPGLDIGTAEPVTRA